MIKNKITNQIISSETIHAKTMAQQGRGLMFKRPANLIMHFKKETKIALHNFFVFYPLEILILDKNKQVIEIKPKFKPFTFYTAKNKGYYCVELGIKESKNQCSVGDILEF